MASRKFADRVVEQNDEIQISFQQSFINKIFILILFLVHFLYSVYTYLYSLLSYLYKYVQFCCVLSLSSNISKESVASLSDKLKTYSKIPHHIAIIVGSEQISYTDFVKLILWCLNSEISHISFYNNKNEIDQHLLYKAIYQQSKDSLLRIKWGVSFSDSIKQMARKSINGYKWQPTLQVNVFNPSSGINCLIEVTKHFCEEGSSKLELSDVECNIQGCLRIPDPDLAIVFSRINSTYGFLPWHLRVTEIQTIPTHHNLTLHTFINVLDSYAKREQRFGK